MIEKRTYKSGAILIPTFPATPATGWLFSYRDKCCRQYTNTLVSLHATCIYGELFLPNADPKITDSSPQFAKLPTLKFAPNQRAVVDFGAIDADNDSLYYVFEQSRVHYDTLAVYNPGYHYLSPIGVQSATTDSAVINHQTGIVTFKTSVLGAYNITVGVYAYKNGQLVSHNRADRTVYVKMPFIAPGACNTSAYRPSVISISNSSLPVTYIAPPQYLADSTYYVYRINAKLGDTLVFNINAFDNDQTADCHNDSTTIGVDGVNMSTSTNYDNDSLCPGGYPCATLNTLNANGRFTNFPNNTATFAFPISCNAVGKENHFFFRFYGKDCRQGAPTMASIFVTVADSQLLSPTFDTLKSNALLNGDIQLFWKTTSMSITPTLYNLILHQNNGGAWLPLARIYNLADSTYTHMNPSKGNNSYKILSVQCAQNENGNSVKDQISFFNQTTVAELANGLQIFPQPVSDFVVIKGDNLLGALQITVLDMQGRIAKKTYQEIADGQLIIDVSNLPKAVYVLILSSADESIKIKLIK